MSLVDELLITLRLTLTAAISLPCLPFEVPHPEGDCVRVLGECRLRITEIGIRTRFAGLPNTRHK